MTHGHERKQSERGAWATSDRGFDREAWRYSGPFTRWNRFKGGLPGLGIASVAFAAYCGYEYMFLQDDHHGHDDAHHSEEHH